MAWPIATADGQDNISNARFSSLPTPPSLPPCSRLCPPQMVLGSNDPTVDAGWVDSAGLTVLHRVAEALDLSYLGLLLEERQKSQGIASSLACGGCVHLELWEQARASYGLPLSV